MNHLKPNPTGVDYAIELLQKPLYEELSKLNADLIGYGRVYKNRRGDKYTLEALNRNEYVDVLGGEDSRFFFFMHNDLDGDTNVAVKVDIVCMVNLDDFFSDPIRRDEEFRTIVSKLIQKSKFKMLKTIIGMEYIEGLISQSYQRVFNPEGNVAFADMHPYHAVTFQTEVYYNRKA